MLTYEKDIKPIKITAREAHKRSVGTEQDYLKLLVDIYALIDGEIRKSNTHCHYWIDSYYLAHRVFRELTRQGYVVSLEKDSEANKEWHLFIDWENVDLDPNKKYILPMEGAYSRDCYGNDLTGYAYKGTNGSWFMALRTNDEDMERLGYTVTAKDIEEAPEWVKVLEPVEVEE